MKAAVLRQAKPIAERPLTISDVPAPQAGPGQVLLRVRACGVCRTDLHIVEGELASQGPLIPGHQIVGEIAGGETAELPLGTRVGVSWMGGTDGTCFYCRRGMENLCDTPIFTGYTVPGGYAEYVVARADFVYPLPAGSERPARRAAALRRHHRLSQLAGGGRRNRASAWGYSASAPRRISRSRFCAPGIAKSTWSTRGESHRRLAAELGAVWVGEERDKPPKPLDRAVTFAPSGDVVVCRSRQPAQRRGGCHQRDPPGPHSAVRLRQLAVGRAPDPQRGQYDPARRPRFFATGGGDRDSAEGAGVRAGARRMKPYWL